MGRLASDYSYRNGMSQQLSEAIRMLRRDGWAVAVVKPEIVGSPHNRSKIEKDMVTAGVRRSEELQHMNYGVIR